MRLRGPRGTTLSVAVLSAIAATLTACAGNSSNSHVGCDTKKPLPALAQQRGIALGTEFVQSRLSNQHYRCLATSNFTSITPNRSFKWQFLEPQQGLFDFTASDAIVNFAAAYNLRVRGCCLAWHVSTPAWLTSRAWTKPELEQVLKNYIMTVMGRYRGRVAEWDVVNEALTSSTATGTFTRRRNIWQRVIGDDYIAEAFRWAHEADPQAELYYNDTGAESPSPHFDAEYKLVTQLQAEHVPINGVGLQMHRPVPVRPPYYPTMPQVLKVMNKFAAIGIHTEITEMDQPLPLPPTKQELAIQAMLFQQMTATCLSVRLCTGVTIWGVNDNDRYSQLVDRHLGAATLIDGSGRAKLGYLAVARALANASGPAAAERPSPGAPA